jgi:Peptidase U49
LQDQQNAAADVGVEARPARDEETSCDEFATKFILEKIEDYARHEKVSARNVKTKRELGILFAAFAITLVAKDRWAASESHPAVQTRIDSMLKLMNPLEGSVSCAIAHASFVALWKAMPEAPGVLKPKR